MHDIERSSTTEGLPVSPSLGPALEAAKLPTHATPVDWRVIFICFISIIVGAAAGGAAWVLLKLISLIMHICFYGQFYANLKDPIHGDARATQLGPWIIAIPVIGAVIIGLIAKYGSRAVAGHGIPEAMEHVLTNQSRIPPRMTFLKPLSAAVSIGTGGPFGAEGPIIATGGALGSLVGQLLSTTAAERKILLSAGAAAGIAAAFGSPIAAVLLAIELLLFEFRPRSIIPVALASAAATLVHMHLDGSEAMFPFTGGPTPTPNDISLLTYTILGGIIGVAAVILTRSVYAVEAFFEHLPIHWIWNLIIGALVVGIIGYIDPGILGPGYFNLDKLLSTGMVLHAALVLFILKFIAWTVSLGSGTSGGTLAPVFTIGGGLAMVLAFKTKEWFPGTGIDVRMAALMGMVAIFAGSSRALLTSIVFAFEVTHEPNCILPSVCGCAAAYLVSAMLMRHSIMTEKMVRQGVRVPIEYGADFLETALVRDVMTRNPIVLKSMQRVAEVRDWINADGPGASHQGYPILDENGHLAGILTRRDLLHAEPPERQLHDLLRRPPILVYSDCSLRDAADHMVNHDIGRLPVVERGNNRTIGIITRSDLLAAHRRRMIETQHKHSSIGHWMARLRKNGNGSGASTEEAPSSDSSRHSPLRDSRDDGNVSDNGNAKEHIRN